MSRLPPIAASLALLVLCACTDESAPVDAPPSPEPGSFEERWPSFDAATDRTAARDLGAVRDGRVTEWNSKGTKSGEGELRNGLREGSWSFFHPSGGLRWRGTFERGVAVGPETAWHDNGTKMLEGTLVEGKREGIYRFWYDNGQLELEVEFRADLRDGTCRRWTRAGVLDRSASGTYSKGRKTAEL